ncbi:MAG: hypothetical protein QG597_1093 [Actinomycetota bacterium]|nr:hypothetical protein [Actinomycetota bacterium]
MNMTNGPSPSASGASGSRGGSASKTERPRYGTWVRMRRVRLVALATVACFAGSALTFVSPWFRLFLLPGVLFGYITLILLLSVYRLGRCGGDYQQRIHRFIAEEAGPRPGEVLDVGCGSGSLAIAVAQAAPECTVVGVDLWDENWEYSQEQCRENARRSGVADRVTFQQQSAAALAFSDASIDTVVSCMTFHEVRDAPDRADAVAQALRVLRPGGRFVFVDVFTDSAYYSSPEHVREVVARAGCSITQESSLRELLPLPYPLRHSKVLGHATVLAGRCP